VVVAAAGTGKIPEIAAAAVEAEIVSAEAETVAAVAGIVAAAEVEIAVVEAGIAVEVGTAVVASLAVFWGQSLVLLVELAVGIAVEAEFG